MLTWRPCHRKTRNWAKIYPKPNSRTPSTCHIGFTIHMSSLHGMGSWPTFFYSMDWVHGPYYIYIMEWAYGSCFSCITDLAKEPYFFLNGSKLMTRIISLYTSNELKLTLFFFLGPYFFFLLIEINP